jgi:chemotaxis protein MotB
MLYLCTVSISNKMKKPNSVIIPIALIVLLNSCAAVYQCGDPKPVKQPAMMGKRLKTVLSERDKLCTDLSSKQKENAGLKNNLAEETNKNKDLTNQYSDLQERYKNLSYLSTTTTDKLSKDLAAKSNELDAKEKLLYDRERTLDEMRKIIARQDSLTNSLNNILRNALLGFNSDELSVEIKNGKVYVSLSDKLLFKSGSSSVEDKGKEALKLLAGVLDKNIDIDILVEGHTDNVPIKTPVYKDNWDLSVARATSIVRILTTDYKIAPTRLTASGKGEYFPKADNETAEGKAKNRRTEIILSPKLDELMKLLKV